MDFVFRSWSRRLRWVVPIPESDFCYKRCREGKQIRSDACYWHCVWQRLKWVKRMVDSSTSHSIEMNSGVSVVSRTTQLKSIKTCFGTEWLKLVICLVTLKLVVDCDSSLKLRLCRSSTNLWIKKTFSYKKTSKCS